MTHFFEHKQQYVAFRETFRKLSREKQASSSDHILFNFIRGRDLKFGFSPLKNPQKIGNRNGDEWGGFQQALSTLRHQIRHRAHSIQFHQKYGGFTPFTLRFGETLTDEQWTKILGELE